MKNALGYKFEKKKKDEQSNEGDNKEDSASKHKSHQNSAPWSELGSSNQSYYQHKYYGRRSGDDRDFRKDRKFSGKMYPGDNDSFGQNDG